MEYCEYNYVIRSSVIIYKKVCLAREGEVYPISLLQMKGTVYVLYVHVSIIAVYIK